MPAGETTMNRNPVLDNLPQFDLDPGSQVNDILKYGPQLAQAQFDEQSQFLPQQSQLALDVGRQFDPQFQDLQNQLRSQGRQGNIDDIRNLSPQLLALRSSQESPQVTEMRNLLQGQILNDLRAGERLTPSQQRAVQQSSRSADVARGTGTGAGSSNREAVRSSLEGRRLLQERQRAASSFVQSEGQPRGNITDTILNLPQNNQQRNIGQPIRGLEMASTQVLPLSAQLAAATLAGQQTNAAVELQATNPFLGFKELAR